MKTIIQVEPWKSDSPPAKILVIRFQALGDPIITLPYLLSVKKQFPRIQMDFLTRVEVDSIPKSLILFNHVFSIGGERNAKRQFILSLLLVPKLLLNRYDAVIDLQNHRISKIIRKLIRARAWVEFDRVSPTSAGVRTKQTIGAIWKWNVSLETKFKFKNDIHAEKLLMDNGWLHDNDLIVLNPAGYCTSRNWPIENYIDFAKLWIQNKNPKTQFVLLLLSTNQDKANQISAQLDSHCINLTGLANQVQAFSIIQRCTLMITEDSGLMHMSWVQGIPTLALFSSSRKDWSAPQGEWSACLDSSDLECGPCQLEICTYGDNRCLTRYSPEYVLKKASALLIHSNKLS